MNFCIYRSVLDLGVRIKGVLIEGIENRTESEEYSAWREREISSLLAEYSDFDARRDEIIEGFYDLHQKIGVPRRKNIPASENLIRLLVRKQGLPEINKAVDIYNIISMKSKLSLGAHDTACITGNISLRLTRGNEMFLPIGAGETKPVKQGEYAYIDDNNDIVCWLEIRQAEKDKVTKDTKNVFYVIQGNEKTPEDLLLATANAVIDTTVRFCGGHGKIIGDILDA